MEKIIVIFIALLIPMHYLGRALFYIDLSLIVLFFIYLVLKNKINIFKLIDKFMISIFLFYLIALLINIINPTEDYHYNIRLLYSLPVILIILNYMFIESNISEVNFLLFQKVLFYLVSFISIIVFFSYILDINIIYSIKKMEYIDTFEHYLFHSKQNIFAILIAFFLYYYLKNKSIVNLILLIFIYLGTYASHGRTAMVTIIIGTITYVFINAFGKKIQNYKKIILLLIILVSSLIFILINDNKLFDLDLLTSGRYNGWLLNVDLILKDNTIFGYGIQGAMQLKEKGLLLFKHPHNLYIETLFSLGLIGFLSLCILTSIFFIDILKSNNLYSKNIAITTFAAVFINVQAIGGIWGFASMLITISVLYIAYHKRKVK
ncbi:MAG: hypothetical protein CL623_08320 [Arcobacter sp.]|nr:hypothetical protein [Arcobacter sp.]|tara:strand:- start:6500 stop:7630 length:1131 start_codon:yes stop_codon:yes gene_type:complete